MTKNMNKLKEFKDMGFRIEENVNHITEVNQLVLDDISLAELRSKKYTTEAGYTVYDVATTTYTILKDSEYVTGYDSASIEDVVKFIEDGLYENI